MKSRREFMKSSFLLPVGIALGQPLLTACRTTAISPPPAAEPARRRAGLPVLELEGTPRQRGRIHGEALRSGIRALVERWKAFLGDSYRLDPDLYLAEFLGNTSFPLAIRKWTPGLLEEVKGLSEGSGIDLDTMMAFQFVDEEWWFGRNRRLRIELPERTGCTVCGAYGQDGLPPILGQNLDFFTLTGGHQVLLRIRNENPALEAYVLTYHGLIGTTGLNSRGVGVCVNALLQLDQRGDGLPVAFVVRGILENGSYDEAVRFVKTIDHASGQAYTIGGPEEISTYECSANKKVRFLPYPGARRLYHTNHPLASDDQGIYRDRILKLIPENLRPTGPGTSEIRYAALEKRLKDPSKRITVETIAAALGSHDDPGHSICVHRPDDGSFGLFSVTPIMELSPSPVLHLSAGPPCSATFGKYTF